jgi:hypothetical protein
MERYPNKLHRKQFYDQWSKRHSADSTSRLVSAVKDEYQNFLGWCVLGGFPASHSLLTQYIRATSPVNTLLSARSASDTGVSFSVQPVAPWWSELPHLAPLPVPAGTFV